MHVMKIKSEFSPWQFYKLIKILPRSVDFIFQNSHKINISKLSYELLSNLTLILYKAIKICEKSYFYMNAL